MWPLLARVVTVWTWLRSSASARLYLRTCDRVGAKTRTFWRPAIDNRGRIVIGDRVRINSHWVPVELATGPQGTIEIDDGVYINYGTLISAEGRVHIGANVMVGAYCIIGDTEVPGIGDHRGPLQLEARPIDVGAEAWLASRVTLLPGARIGEGAVIAAGSVVAGEIPAGAVAGGIPARILRAAAPAAVEPESAADAVEGSRR